MTTTLYTVALTRYLPNVLAYIVQLYCDPYKDLFNDVVEKMKQNVHPAINDSTSYGYFMCNDRRCSCDFINCAHEHVRGDPTAWIRRLYYATLVRMNGHIVQVPCKYLCE